MGSSSGFRVGGSNMVVLWVALMLFQGGKLAAAGLELSGGWYVQSGRVIWGYAQHNGWWRPGQRPNITRNAEGDVRPNRTEDLERLTENMLRYGYPGFEHNFGLWYDRRRDEHDSIRRSDGNVLGPFLEQPWARSSQPGAAWDGLPLYDLEKFNPWYFDRLRSFAALCSEKRLIFFHNFYMQHALLEGQYHYADFPWRPMNCVQRTGMPKTIPAANAFYDISVPERARLHKVYMQKCLDELGEFPNVVHLLSEEYTGPASFVKFWLEVVSEWQQQKGMDVHLALGATRDVMDEILADRRLTGLVSTLDLRYWWYLPDGSLHAPPGGQQVPGRYTSGSEASKTTPQQIYRQVLEYRNKYPEKGIIHNFEASRHQSWAFLMAGGSMIIRRMEYPDAADPQQYETPEHSAIIQPSYDFIRTHLAEVLPKMKPSPELLLDKRPGAWCLADTDRTNVLVYLLKEDELELNLGPDSIDTTYRVRWFNPRDGGLIDAGQAKQAPGAALIIPPPDRSDWVLWLKRTE